MSVAFLVEKRGHCCSREQEWLCKGLEAQSWGTAGLIRMGITSTPAMRSSGGSGEMRRPGRMGLSTGLRAWLYPEGNRLVTHGGTMWSDLSCRITVQGFSVWRGLVGAGPLAVRAGVHDQVTPPGAQKPGPSPGITPPSTPKHSLPPGTFKAAPC